MSRPSSCARRLASRQARARSTPCARDPIAGDGERRGGGPARQPDLGPERTREYEVGFDAAAFDNRVSFEVTGFQARTYGALIGVVYPPSEGFTQTQLQNVGTLENKGLEVQVNGDILRGQKVNWSGRVSITSLASNTVDVGGVPIFTGLGSYVREGYPVPALFGYKIMNPDAIADPIVKSDQYLGSVYPTHITSIGTTLTLWQNLTLDVLGEFNAGGHLANWIGYQGIVRNIWQPCYAVQAKLRAYNGADKKKGTADDVLNALDGVNARDRGRCHRATVLKANFDARPTSQPVSRSPTDSRVTCAAQPRGRPSRSPGATCTRAPSTTAPIPRPTTRRTRARASAVASTTSCRRSRHTWRPFASPSDLPRGFHDEDQESSPGCPRRRAFVGRLQGLSGGHQPGSDQRRQPVHARRGAEPRRWHVVRLLQHPRRSRAHLVDRR